MFWTFSSDQHLRGILKNDRPFPVLDHVSRWDNQMLSTGIRVNDVYGVTLCRKLDNYFDILNVCDLCGLEKDTQSK